MTKILERNLWRSLRTTLRGYGRLVRIENVAGVGTPDVYWRLPGTGAWLELKVEAAGQSFSIGRAQIAWLADEVAAGGPAFVVLRVGRATYLIRGDRAELLEGVLTDAELAELADVVCPRTIDPEAFVAAVEHFGKELS